VHFLTHVNLTHTSVWDRLVIPDRYFETIKRDTTHGKYASTIGAYKMRTLSWYHMCYRRETLLNQIFDKDYPSFKADYLIIEPYLLPDVLPFYDTIDHSSRFNHYLLRRKTMLGREFIYSIPSNRTDDPVSDEYLLIGESTIDTLAVSSLYVELTLTLESPNERFSSWVVLEIKDEADEMLDYNYISLPYLKKSWNGERNNFRGGFLLPSIPMDAYRIIIYVWNMEKSEFQLGDGLVEVYRLYE
jgi:hypothetical protein